MYRHADNSRPGDRGIRSLRRKDNPRRPGGTSRKACSGIKRNKNVSCLLVMRKNKEKSLIGLSSSRSHEPQARFVSLNPEPQTGELVHLSFSSINPPSGFQDQGCERGNATMEDKVRSRWSTDTKLVVYQEKPMRVRTLLFLLLFLS